MDLRRLCEMLEWRDYKNKSRIQLTDEQQVLYVRLKDAPQKYPTIRIQTTIVVPYPYTG